MITTIDPIGLDLSRFHPYRDQVLIERMEDRETPGVIIIPDIAKRRPHRGKVLRAGPGYPTTMGTYRPLQVKAGDVVQYQSADVDCGDYVIIQEADILFIENA